ncbi:MAG: WhiB family transcriptional regulator [Actinobacteria bacterium]|nr:WhiB family transcriptional regulator [Actinomycetota bacterium]
MSVTEYGQDWWARAACRSADPELFFPISALGPSLDQVAAAKAVCGDCRVRQECLSFALSTGQVHGVWGGLSADERRGMRHRDLAAVAGPGG